MKESSENQNQNKDQDKKVLSKPEQMNLLLKDLNDPTKQSDKDDIVSKMLSLILGDKKNESGNLDGDGNLLKTRKENKGIDNDDKMMMMALAFILGGLAIVATGGGAVLASALPAIGAIPDIMKLTQSFLDKPENELDEVESKKIGKSSLALLFADKVKDNMLKVGEYLLSDDNIFAKSIGKYIKSLSEMGADDKEKELNELKVMVKSYVISMEKTESIEVKIDGKDPAITDKKIDAIFDNFKQIIDSKNKDFDPKKLTSLFTIQGEGFTVLAQSNTVTVVKEGGSKAGESGPSPISSVRGDRALPRAQSLSSGRSALAPALALAPVPAGRG